MKVLVISRLYLRPQAMTGAAVHRQCAELSDLGIDVSVICPVPRFRRPPMMFGGLATGRRVLKRIDGVSVMYSPYYNVPNRVSATLEVTSLRRTLLRSVRTLPGTAAFDIVHAHSLFPTVAASLDVARSLGAPILVSTHGSDVHTNPYRNKGIARYSRKAITECDRVIAVSQQLAGEVLKLAQPRVPVKVVRNGVDMQVFKPCTNQPQVRDTLGLPRYGVGICTVGRLVIEKGIGELMKAFGSLVARDESTDVWLTVVGDGPARQLIEAWVRREGLEDRVFLAGARPNAEIADWIGACDIFVLPSYREGLPNVVLEAMACGRPVVATEVGGIPEAVGPGTAILIPPREAAPLAGALATLVGSSGLRERLGSAGLERIREKFSWRRSAEELKLIYEEVAQQGPSGTPH
ncbi:glycosyltransferase [Gemmatimonadota bacterium]